MSKAQRGFLTEHLNAEPLLFRGCTYSELGTIVVVSVVLWLPLSLLIASLLGGAAMGLGAATLGVIGTVYGMATWFARIKRGRPDGYYQQRLALWLHDKGLRDSGAVRRTGAWSIGRTVEQ